MDISKVIKGRRSIRRYSARKVPANAVRKVLDSARWAPSLHNMQPWHFIIPEGAMRQRLLKVLKKTHDKELLFIRVTLRSCIKAVENAPVVIMVYNNTVVENNIH